MSEAMFTIPAAHAARSGDRKCEEHTEVLLRRQQQSLVTVLHELRNPLAPIASAVELLGRRGEDPRCVALAQGVIRRQLHQLTRIMDDLLDLPRIADGTMTLHLEETNLADVIASAVEAARPRFERRGHVLTVFVPPQPLEVRGDAVRLIQVMTNLLVNAAKYTPPGGLIAVMAQRTGDEAVVRVTDNGIGIAPEMLTRIFDPFTQACPGSEEARGGLGIGLAIARQLITLHGGSIGAHSAGPGCGSEFVVRLPILGGA